MKNLLNWNRIFKHWIRDAKVLFFVVGLFMLGRLTLFTLFHDERASDGSLWQLLLFLQRSFQYDVRFPAYLLLPTFFLAFLAVKPKWEARLNKLRFCIGSIFSIITLLLCIGNIGFYAEYHDQFNSWVYGLFADDFGAIMQTIWIDYPVVWIALGTFSACFVVHKLFKKWMSLGEFSTERLDQARYPWLIKSITAILCIYLLFVASRGSFGTRPLKEREVQATSDHFLTKLTLNPFFALYYTHRANQLLSGSKGIEYFLPEGNLKEAIKFISTGFTDDEDQIDEHLVHFVKTPEIQTKPKHVFIIVMESQESWPMYEDYAELGLMEQMKDLANRGIWVKSFVSAEGNTIGSLSSIITGLPSPGVYTNYQPSTRTPFPTTITEQFKKLGYKTNLFFGGTVSWQRLGQFAYNQAFDNVYGEKAIGPKEGNRWGVDDEHLFNFILEKLDPDVPSLNVIMTTSHHPPHTVDVYRKGFPLKEMPESLKEKYDGRTSLAVLGHFWYCDRCVGDFVKQAEQKLDPSLFVITADHPSRRFLNIKPDVHECATVPCIFYGPEVLKNVVTPEKMAGCHLDIAPTILEMLAPEGFKYYSFGRNLFDPTQRQRGFGRGVVSTPDMIYLVESNKGRYWHGDTFEEEIAQYKNEYNAHHGIAWWRIMKGERITN